jgi:hypothetical protein
VGQWAYCGGSVSGWTVSLTVEVLCRVEQW